MPRTMISTVWMFRKVAALVVPADREAEEDRDDVHQLIAGGLGDTLNNAGLLHQVAHHQAADQNGGVRQGQGNDDGNDDGEQDLLGLGDAAGAVMTI